MRLPLLHIILALQWLDYLTMIHAFQCPRVVTHIPTRRPAGLFKEDPSSTKSFLFQDNAKTIRVENDIHADEVHKKEDSVGSKTQQFAVGDTVRVVLPDLRAYQIPPEARGTFDDNSVFVPDETLKYLVLPVGLQGTVEKVYDAESVLSANLPIRVAFVRESSGETLQPPVDFTMYFAPSELELVTESSL